MLKKSLNFLRVLLIALWHDLHQGSITLRAMGLVYSTLLSLAPLLALAFSVLKGFGVHNQLEPLLRSALTPLGEQAEELTQQVLGFVDNVQVGVLGFAGLAMLLYTVVSLMQKVEEAFNHVWRVKRPRPLLLQFRDYLSVVLVGPILLFSALGMWTAMTRQAWLHSSFALDITVNTLVQLSPTLLIIAAFTFLYLFMPNTRVKPWAALVGASCAGIVWQIAGWLFAVFVVRSGQQTAIYSVFASLFLFMLWLYVAWLITLIGARLAYYVQYPDALYLAQQPPAPSVQTREMLAAAVLREVGLRFRRQQSPATLAELLRALPVSRFLLEDVLEDLITYGVLSRDDAEPPHYLLRTSPEQLSVAAIRRYFWQGDPQQQQQAAQVRAQTGLSAAWLAELADNPHLTVQQLLEAQDATSV